MADAVETRQYIDNEIAYYESKLEVCRKPEGHPFMKNLYRTLELLKQVRQAAKEWKPNG